MKICFPLSWALHVVFLVVFSVDLNFQPSFDITDVEAISVGIVRIEDVGVINRQDRKGDVKEELSLSQKIDEAGLVSKVNNTDQKVILEEPSSRAEDRVKKETSSDLESVSDSKNLPEKVSSLDVPLPSVSRIESEQNIEKIVKKEEKPSQLQSKESKVDKEISTIQKKDFKDNRDAELLDQQVHLSKRITHSGKSHSSGGDGLKISKVENKKNFSNVFQNEMNLLRKKISNNWSVLPGLNRLKEVQVRIRFHLNRDGLIIKDPDVSVTGGVEVTRKILVDSAQKAIIKSQPFHLPADQYNDWKDIIVTFKPSGI
ncbi:cell envelope integrity protein TolA [Candidatus Liberibacter sp.]|uniref:cell envelope integrity protein TolA n=1 Tax=Candidatus Liberibacter sp. TaxID=34022 RepID=UPI0015F657CF|nr:cell envelope integrity protein TolA [Candidatus Liberibacter sp.]MBA5723554.1 cell envelope integrity protein TolA [Candidatus Liberibacter sp.]